MYIARDTEIALVTATALVNTHINGTERLTDGAALDEFLAVHEISGTHDRSEAELDSIRALRSQLRSVWEAGTVDEAAAIINDMLSTADAVPRLITHNGWGWHLHFSAPETPLVRQLGAELAMGLADLLRSDDLGRLRCCAAPECTAVVADLSRNRSRLYCDTGNCGNRIHVAAYRARRQPSKFKKPQSATVL